MKNRIKIVPLIISAAWMTGCATVFSESVWPVALNVPTSTNFIITNEAGEKVDFGTTPAKVRLPSGASFFDGEKYTFHFTKMGFQPKTVTLDTTLNDWYWGNLLVGNVLGLLVVDPGTGAMFKLPNLVSAELTPSGK